MSNDSAPSSITWKSLSIEAGALFVGIAIGFGLGRLPLASSQKRDAAGRLLGSYFNSSRAKAIEPGAPLSKVISELGDPIGQKDGWMEFEPSPEGQTIRIRIGPAGLVSEIHPGATGPGSDRTRKP